MKSFFILLVLFSLSISQKRLSQNSSPLKLSISSRELSDTPIKTTKTPNFTRRISTISNSPQKQTKSQSKKSRKLPLISQPIISSEDRSLLILYNLPSNSFEFMANLTDQSLKQQAYELKAFMRKLGPAVSEKPIKKKSYEDNLNVAKKRLNALRKRQVKKYEEWRKQTWANIEKFLNAKQKIYDVDDTLNISENEKYYQLFLVEDSDKRQHLVPFLDLENRLLEIIETELEIIADDKALKRASLRIVNRFNSRLKRSERRRSRRHRTFYLQLIRAEHRRYMKQWDNNELFTQNT